MRKLLIIMSVMLLVGAFASPGAGADTFGAGASTPDCDFPVTVEDATGTEITLNESPDRVVTTSPSAAQVMWEIGAEERVVGLSEFALYLDGADERTLVVEREEGLNLEVVVDLEPDLVLAPNTTDQESIAQMRDAGLTVYHFSQEESIEDIFAVTERIGTLTGECAGAADTINWMNEELDIVADAIDGEERPGVMYLFFDFTAGANTFINEIIEAAGAENLATTAGIEEYEAVSDEIVIAEDPEWIILNSDDPVLPESDAIQETTAAQEDQYVVVQIEHLNQPAPRTVEAIITIAETLHPEAYAAAVEAAESDDDDLADEADDQDDADDSSVETTGETSDDEADALPGFGVLVALFGIGAGAAGHAIRRQL